VEREFTTSETVAIDAEYEPCSQPTKRPVQAWPDDGFEGSAKSAQTAAAPAELERVAHARSASRAASRLTNRIGSVTNSAHGLTIRWSEARPARAEGRAREGRLHARREGRRHR